MPTLVGRFFGKRIAKSLPNLLPIGRSRRNRHMFGVEKTAPGKRGIEPVALKPSAIPRRIGFAA
jgi:hypothetical protein